VLVVEAYERHPAQARRPRQDRFEIGDDQIRFRALEFR
jgi:hypothetical protein